jgi:hypothetical protein
VNVTEVLFNVPVAVVGVSAAVVVGDHDRCCCHFGRCGPIVVVVVVVSAVVVTVALVAVCCLCGVCCCCRSSLVLFTVIVVAVTVDVVSPVVVELCFFHTIRNQTCTNCLY